MIKFAGSFFILVQLLTAVAYSRPLNIPEGMQPADLKVWLKRETYLSKHKLHSYKTARKLMYNYIDNIDNEITGVYSGYKVSWEYGGEGNNPFPINCEHTVPQSFFKGSSPMKSDLHHIYPTFNRWNSYRSNSPYGEIEDGKTEKWFRKASLSFDKPDAEEINEYSEYTRKKFEPRESHKGNVARAIFYFYTMYAKRVRPISSLAKVETLIKWHKQDPVDREEKKK